MNTLNTSRFAPLLGIETRLSVSDLASLILMIIGAISLGLFSAFGFDLVAFLMAPMMLGTLWSTFWSASLGFTA